MGKTTVTLSKEPTHLKAKKKHWFFFYKENSWLNEWYFFRKIQ